MSDTSASSGRLWPHVVSGVSGRVTAELFMSPINLLKVRLQHNLQLKRLPVPAAMLQLARDEGALSLWRGLPPRLMWATPLSAATFTYYQAAKKVSSGEASDGAAGKRDSRIVLAGPFMLAASVAVRTPFDIAEQRLQLEPPATGADAARRPSAFRRALSVRMQTKIYATAADPHPSMPAAGWRVLFRGNRPPPRTGPGTFNAAKVFGRTLARVASNAPSGAIMFTVYEAGHRWIEARLG
ncbi:hypothetical protein EMIHUDRAFT_102260 [Emiliania huxleyi CCMP1516]|uniref:Mitochondrial carrier protein n=2 Tax=Emiliania huxleyi TaxID=2903 RepID=A0A0D3J5G0_EMIH1|nr:hypothetical protein EMIHUDRAFT_102260 [Emiliania huxleyi CCMP1516]EOD18745.1 hypothetical protein EMIHUDRAFT_102260 [Emiliania huxleyi CCMP1516]|eukprot:XP_005771174.1 hypothetical protein EMIHUDRAFT_102260 [Emiliania huxleyi CCMP1516]